MKKNIKLALKKTQITSLHNLEEARGGNNSSISCLATLITIAITVSAYDVYNGKKCLAEGK